MAQPRKSPGKKKAQSRAARQQSSLFVATLVYIITLLSFIFAILAYIRYGM